MCRETFNMACEQLRTPHPQRALCWRPVGATRKTQEPSSALSALLPSPASPWSLAEKPATATARKDLSTSAHLSGSHGLHRDDKMALCKDSTAEFGVKSCSTERFVTRMSNSAHLGRFVPRKPCFAKSCQAKLAQKPSSVACQWWSWLLPPRHPGIRKSSYFPHAPAGRLVSAARQETKPENAPSCQHANTSACTCLLQDPVSLFFGPQHGAFSCRAAKRAPMFALAPCRFTKSLRRNIRLDSNEEMKRAVFSICSSSSCGSLQMLCKRHDA